MAKIQSSRIVGLKIREFRRNAGVTQEVLAEMLDVTPQQVQKYESGANKLNTDRLQQVAQALKVPVQAFFMSSDSLTPLAESEQLLLTAYRNIPTRETQDALIKLALAATQQIESAQ
jgi:transcriptional regulator with XRE-family HTH domain